ncbi:MAG: heterodisulfide reductase-related iron-sulfur binding cluster [Gammaproteobacteria bacterium]|nr:heterodisulfide reductase-related iron-sulfur binding cluster [Gammaproteobacteria bacterium]MDE0249364.1 heterodisulfide reductase-related iron-sulfur binding cluster [Gammaproteobacteria bacterium]
MNPPPVGGGPARPGLAALGEALAAQDDRLSNCVHCGFCLPACPTYVRLGDEADSPRGRLHLMRAVAEGRLDPGSEAFQLHIDRCLGCRACEPVCPSGVEYGFLLERARQVARRAGTPARLVDIVLALVERPLPLALWMAAGRLVRSTGIASLAARPGRWPERFRTLRLGAAMLAASRPWRPAAASPPRQEAGRGSASAAPVGPRVSRGRVGILTGCVQRHLFGHVNEATSRVLAANGWEVVGIRRQGCCGALHAHGGRLARAGSMALRNIAAFRVAEVDWIVANAAGCGATMREYHHLAGEAAGRTAEDGHGANGSLSAEDAAWFSRRVRDVTELLVDGDGARARTGGALPLRVAYDPPCHLLHGQGVADPPTEVLQSIPGLDLVPVPDGDECCGGAGIYGIGHPELGGRIGASKVDAVLETGADVLATGNPGCAMQIGGGLGMRGSAVRVVHPVELLDESYRRGGVYRSGRRSALGKAPRRQP